MRPTDRLAGHRALGLLCGRGRWHRPPSTMNSEFISSPDCQLLPARRDRQRSLYFMSTRARTLAHAHEHGRRPSWPRTSDSRSQVRPRFSPLERPSHLPWPETSSDPSVELEPRARPANGNPAHPHCRSSSITRRGHPCAPSGCTSHILNVDLSTVCILSSSIMHSFDTCGPTQAAKCVDDHVARRPSWLAVLFSTAPGCRTRPESDCGQRSSTSTSIRARNRFGGRSADLRSLARTPLAAYGTSLADDLATYRSHIAYTQLRPPLRPRSLSASTTTTTHLSSPRLSTDTTKRAMRKQHDARVPTYSLRARLYRLSRAHTRMPRCTVRRYGPTASIQHPGKIHHPKHPNGRAQHGLERQPSSVHSRPPCLASRRAYPPFRDVLAFSALARTLTPPMPIYTPILHAYPAHPSPSLSGRAPRARPFHARARADPAIAAENRVERRNGACDAWSTLHASQTHTHSPAGVHCSPYTMCRCLRTPEVECSSAERVLEPRAQAPAV